MEKKTLLLFISLESVYNTSDKKCYRKDEKYQRDWVALCNTDSARYFSFIAHVILPKSTAGCIRTASFGPIFTVGLVFDFEKIFFKQQARAGRESDCGQKQDYWKDPFVHLFRPIVKILAQNFLPSNKC